MTQDRRCGPARSGQSGWMMASIPPERAWQSSAGVEVSLPPGVQVFVSGFYNHLWNIPRGVDEIVPTDDGLRRVFFRPDEQGRAFGLEAMLR